MGGAFAGLALVPGGLITGGVLTIIFAAVTQSHTYFSTMGGIAITVAGAAAIPVAAVLIKLLARATGELYHTLADYIFDRAAAEGIKRGRGGRKILRPPRLFAAPG